MFSIIKPLIVLAITTVVCADLMIDVKNDVGEYGKFNTWRKEVCEKIEDDKTLLEEFADCLQLEIPEVNEALLDCFAQALPDTDKFIVPYTMEACKNPEVFKQVDSCFAEWKKNAEEKGQPTGVPEPASRCYSNVVIDHNLTGLLMYHQRIASNDVITITYDEE